MYMKGGNFTNERIKKLRRELGLNQTDFGLRIGVKQTTVAGYENGARAPLDTVVASICREFNVSEVWLRTGEGEMFITLSRSEEISAFVGDILSGEPDFRARFISALARLTPKQWKQLEGITNTLISEMQKKTNQ